LVRREEGYKVRGLFEAAMKILDGRVILRGGEEKG